MGILDKPNRVTLRSAGAICVAVISFGVALSAGSIPRTRAVQEQAPAFKGQPQEEAERKSSGCISCHGTADEPTMHATKSVLLGCVDCHGGNPEPRITPGTRPDAPENVPAKEKAHVQPRISDLRIAIRRASVCIHNG